MKFNNTLGNIALNTIATSAATLGALYGSEAIIQDDFLNYGLGAGAGVLASRFIPYSRLNTTYKTRYNDGINQDEWDRRWILGALPAGAALLTGDVMGDLELDILPEGYNDIEVLGSVVLTAGTSATVNGSFRGRSFFSN